MTSRHYFFPMALEPVPLQWFNKLCHGSINSWEELEWAFAENFGGVLTRPSTRNKLRNCKQLPNESLRDYYRCFAEKRSTIFDVSDYDVIEFFSNGIRERWQYQDFCRNWPNNGDQFRRHVQNLIDSEECT